MDMDKINCSKQRHFGVLAANCAESAYTKINNGRTNKQKEAEKERLKYYYCCYCSYCYYCCCCFCCCCCCCYCYYYYYYNNNY